MIPFYVHLHCFGQAKCSAPLQHSAVKKENGEKEVKLGPKYKVVRADANVMVEGVAQVKAVLGHIFARVNSCLEEKPLGLRDNDCKSQR